MNSSEQKTLKFLLADDHTIVRQGMQMVVEDLVENHEIYTASSLQQIREQINQHQFDIAILDAQMQDGNCISVIPEFKKLQPNVKIMVFTSFEEENYSLKFIEAGADGFLSKLSEESEIENAVSELINTGKYFPPFTRKLLEISADDRALLNPLNRLSERELEIAELYAKGFGNLEIANALDLKQNTVSTFKKRIFEKLKVESLVDLVELIRIHHSI
ncbi:MAG TPA: response regulator transcription factor [Moheibacter sp.]|nr:response regulator transcription factor [Moheibacter sp.]